jgi:hypothetical protein
MEVRMMSRARILVPVLVSFLASDSASHAVPLPEGERGTAQYCGTYVSGCEFGWHRLLGGYSQYLYPHSECGQCLFGVDNCHPDCELDDEDHETQAAYSAALEAAGRGDVVALMAARAVIPSWVRINEFRASVQLLACDRALVLANLPLHRMRAANLALHE